MMVRVLLLRLLLLVIGHCGREFRRIVAAGARIHRIVVAFFIHLDAETLELLSGIPLHRIGLLEAWQGRRTAIKNAFDDTLEILQNFQ